MNSMASSAQTKSIRSEPELLGADAFAEQVSAALDHCGDALWLGLNSPLAAPYLLGTRLDSLPGAGRDATPAQRGAILRSAMDAAADAIEDAELRTLIENRYLKRNQFLSNTGLALRSGVSERTFYRLRNRAIAAFAARLYTLLVPPLRLEQPASVEVVGRRALLAQLRSAAAVGDALYISGGSGMGKSTLAAALFSEIGPETAPFWFTVRPGFNDHFSSFLFALAFFLHNQGAPNTWRQIIAESDRAGASVFGAERSLALLRHDFAMLAHRVLLCIDEVDLLRPEVDEHNKLMTLLDELKSIAPGKASLLFIGQRVVIETAVQVTMPPFEVGEVREWAEQSRLPRLTETQVMRLTEATNGSPLLLVLFAALVASGEEVDSLLITFDSDPSLEALLVRIWRRLDEGERALLMRLSVFDVAAPADAWRQHDAHIKGLCERGLLNRTPNELLAVSPHLRALVYARIPVELRRSYHAEASVLLEERGNITGAMRQALKARDEARALTLWLTHRETELKRGQSEVALNILEQIATTDLPKEAQATSLQAARAELLIRAGRAEEANTALRSLAPTGDDIADAHIKQLLSRSYDAMGDNERATQLLDESFALLPQPLLFSRVRTQNLQVYLHIVRLRDLEKARDYALRARVEAEVSLGWVEEVAGNERIALEHYRTANALSRQQGSDSQEHAYISSHLGRVLMSLGETEEGLDHMTRAAALYEESGNWANALSNRINIAYGHTMAGRAELALQGALQGLNVALRMRHSHLICGLAAAAGEAAVYADQWEEAERYLNLSLQQEEEFFRPWALTALGVLRGKQERHAEAVRWLKEAAEEANAIEDMHGEAYALQPLFESQRALGDIDGARVSITRAHELYVALGMEPKAAETGQLLAELR